MWSIPFFVAMASWRAGAQKSPRGTAERSGVSTQQSALLAASL
jgi:hypothetical protein